MTKSKVYVLYTGGTFGMEPDLSRPGNPLKPMELEKLKKSLPEADLLAPGVEITLDKFDHLIDSSSMNPKDWINIATKIGEHYAEHDGFIIVQGTDTLAYTASALSFMLENLAKPVIVTGSQLPLANARTDANLNYGHALQIAGYKATDLPCIPEVIVVFADKILRGCRTRKMSASAWTGFDTPNCPPLGEIGEHVRIFENQIRPMPPSGLELQVHTTLNSDVLDISLYPGMRAKHLKQILNLDDVKGVVLRTYGTGNAPEETDFIEALGDGIGNGEKIVVNITQCPQGAVEMGLYTASVGLIDKGVISGGDMTPEAALSKLMVTMGTRIGAQVKLQMQISQRGEQSQNLFDFNFKTITTPTDEPRSDFVVPDRRFDPTALSAGVMRMKNLTVKLDEAADEQAKVAVDRAKAAAELAKTTVELAEATKTPVIDLYMNYPTAKAEDGKKEIHPRRLHRIKLFGSTTFDVVQTLPREKMKNIIGDSDIVLTFVPSPGVSFKFEKLSLSMFTRAE